MQSLRRLTLALAILSLALLSAHPAKPPRGPLAPAASPGDPWWWGPPAASSTAPPPSWAGSMIALWRLEEASGTRVNDAGTTCGSTCNLSDNNTVTRSTVEFREGAAAAEFVSASIEYLSCEDAVCTPLDLTGSISWGGWARTTSFAFEDTIVEKAAPNAGFRASRTNLDRLACTIGDGADQATATAGAGFWNDLEWAFWTCVFNDATDTIRAYRDGIERATATQQSLAENSASFKISDTIAGDAWDGQQDEVWVYAGAMPAASQCRICSCEVDGSRCLCDGATWVDEGRRVSDCSSCTLPTACDQPTPVIP